MPVPPIWKYHIRKSWTCPKCGLINFSEDTVCVRCKTKKPYKPPSLSGWRDSEGRVY